MRGHREESQASRTDAGTNYGPPRRRREQALMRTVQHRETPKESYRQLLVVKMGAARSDVVMLERVSTSPELVAGQAR